MSDYYETEVDITDIIKDALIKRGASKEDVEEMFYNTTLKAGVDVYSDVDGGLFCYKEYCYKNTRY